MLALLLLEEAAAAVLGVDSDCERAACEEEHDVGVVVRGEVAAAISGVYSAA